MSDLSSNDYIKQGKEVLKSFSDLKLKRYNELTRAEKSNLNSSVLMNTAEGLFKGSISRLVFTSILSSPAIGYLSLGYFLGKSFKKSADIISHSVEI